MVNVPVTHGHTETLVEPRPEAPSAPNVRSGVFSKIGTRFTILAALAAGAAAVTPANPGAQAQDTKPQPTAPQPVDVMPRPVPPATIEAWLKEHPEFGQDEFDKLADQLAHDQFRVREKASDLLSGKLRALHAQANPAPVGVGPYVRRKVAEGKLDPEASARIGRMPTGEYQTTRVPPIRGKAADVVKLLSGVQNQVVLDLTPAGEAKLAEALVHVDANANGFWQVLDQVRGATGFKMRFEGGGRPVLTDRETGNVPTYELLGQKDTFALLQEGSRHSSRVVVADEPTKGLIVCIDGAKILAGPALPVTVSAAACPPTRLQRYNVSAPPCEASTGSLQNPIQWQSPNTKVEVSVIRGRDMFDKTMKAAIGEQIKAQNQNVRVAGVEVHKDGSCTVTLEIGVYEEIPWPPTPYTWDVKTYADGAMTRAEFLSSDGKTLGSTRKTLKANMRVLTATYSVSSVPTNIKVKGFGSITEPQKIEFTTDRDRLPKAERPFIAEN